MRDALWCEWLKLRRSRMPGVTLAAAALVPAMSALFMLVQMHPDWAERMGMMGMKAKLAASAATWTAYFGLLSQAIAVGGLLLFGMVAIWMFGREHADGTMNDLLALPTPRSSLVRAKFLLVGAWCLAMALAIVGLGLVLGLAIGLPGWSTTLALTSLGSIASTTVMMIVLVTPFGLAASLGRGTMAGVGALLAALFFSQIIAALGLGGWFPWSIPALHSGVPGSDTPPLGPGSYVVVVTVGAVGALLTERAWTVRDQR
jgi:ABC-2 type transport system permease protein